MKSVFWGLLLSALPVICFSQTYNMPAGETVTCSGTFYDPGGSAANYSDAAPSVYVSTFTAQSGDQIDFLFAQLPPAYTKNILLESGDILKVYDGPTTASTLVATYSVGTTTIPPLRSTGSSLTFEFITDGDGLSDAGWYALIKCVTMPDGSYPLTDNPTPVSIGCDVRNDFFDPGGYMNNYPSSGTTIVSSYTNGAGKKMLVNINSLNTNYLDTLFIYDGNSTSAPLIGKYKGFVSNVMFTTTTDAITFKFKENGDGITNTGWNITATCIREESITCGAPATFYDHAGSSKTYKSSGIGERFLTTFTAPVGQLLEGTLTNFSTNYPFRGALLIYDGPNTSSPLIGTYSGTGFNTFKVSSSGNSLTFYIDTKQNSYWNSNFDVTFNCTTTQQPTTFTVGGSSSPMPVPCGVTSKIIDLGGDTYGSEDWAIPSPYIQTYTTLPGQYIKLKFTELNISDDGEVLNIYDGSSTSAPLIATYKSNNNPSFRNLKPTITATSSSNSITVEHITDKDFVTAMGYEAELSCISQREGSNFSLGNSSGTVSILCGTSSTFEDFYGVQSYTDNAIQEFTTTYNEANGDVTYFAFMEFNVPAGDTLYAYDGSLISDPLIGKYSGLLSPFSIGATGPVTFKFKTDGLSAANSKGWYATISCNDPLPVKFINFDAIRQKESVQLTWTTASEVNNKYFVVEKSINGIDFVSVDTIMGANNSERELNYNYWDIEPYETVSYYRIKQIDFDGFVSYSTVRAVNGNEIRVKLFPQPVSDRLSIIINDSEIHEIKIHLADEVGKVLLNKFFYINNSMEIDMSGYAQGIYFFTITEGTYSVTQKILKQ